MAAIFFRVVLRNATAVATTIAGTTMASPEIWGPRLWRMMHLMADISDRRDVVLLWNTFLKMTAIAIPCQKCQKHMAEYWSAVRFVPRDWEKLSADQTRAVVRLRIHEFHNAVSARLGKPTPALAPLAESLDRGAICREIRAIFESLKAEWQAVHPDWKRTTAVLIQLLCCGPM